jgi:protein-tyrosine phosphatase
METSNSAAVTGFDLRELLPPQRSRLERFAVGQAVDLHCHCLPCVDDGPGTMVEALQLCRALAEDGITVAIATPHQLGRYAGRNGAPAVREGVAALNRSLMVEGIPLRVFPGGDVRVDERIARLLHDDHVLSLADRGVYVLLELPHDTFIDPATLITHLVKLGRRPIMSHPERHRHLTANPHLIEPWLKAGVELQITSGSLVGDFGGTALRAAWYWLETGAAALVASDAHDVTDRPPRMSKAIELIAHRLGEDVARRVCGENPGASCRAGRSNRRERRRTTTTTKPTCWRSSCRKTGPLGVGGVVA